MRYPIALELGDTTHAFGVVVPDLPGYFSAGDSLDQAIDNARDAIELWLEAVIDDGGTIPDPSSIDKLQSSPRFKGWIWSEIDVDLALRA